MNEWIQFGLFLVAVSGAVITLLALVLRWGASQEQRLREDEDDDAPISSTQFTASKRAPTDLQQELRLAGFYRPTAILEYTAVRALLVLLPLLGGGAAALIAPPPDVLRILLVTAIGAGLGYSLPRVYLTARARTRARQIERALPLIIDLLTLCLSAGQNLLDSLRQVSEELRFSHPAVASEVAIAQRHAALHSLEHAMKQWADRTPIPEVTNLALLLIQSERLGTDAAGTLLEMSNNLRVSLRQRAEAQANRVSFWMLFPSVFCFWIAAAIILIAPPYLQFFQYRQQAAQLFNQSRININRANDQARPAANKADEVSLPLAPGR
jgi:tight adherence protein C